MAQRASGEQPSARMRPSNGMRACRAPIECGAAGGRSRRRRVFSRLAGARRATARARRALGRVPGARGVVCVWWEEGSGAWERLGLGDRIVSPRLPLHARAALRASGAPFVLTRAVFSRARNRDRGICSLTASGVHSSAPRPTAVSTRCRVHPPALLRDLRPRGRRRCSREVCSSSACWRPAQPCRLRRPPRQ